MTQHTTFNLIDEPWVPCLLHDGKTAELSLREVFTQAGDISRLTGESSLQAAVILRTLLAIYWRAHYIHGNLGVVSRSQDYSLDWWTAQFNTGEPADFNDPVFVYLEGRSERFDLLHPEAPFLQVSSLSRKDGSVDSPARLIPEAESDYFTMRAGKAKDSLALAEATRWLLTLQAYDYSGIKPGAVGDPRVKGGKGYPIGPGWTGQTGLVVLHGDSLHQTLLLNTPAEWLRERLKDDLPVWERPPVTAEPRNAQASTPIGPCDVLTWQSRRIRLHVTDGVVTGVLVSNGDKIKNKNQYEDPMTGYRYSRNQSSKAETVFMPQEHDPDLTIWRGLAPLLQGNDKDTQRKGEPEGKRPQTIQWLSTLRQDELNEDQVVSIELIGITYGPQQSSVTHTFSVSLPFKLGILVQANSDFTDVIVNSAKAALRATVALGQFAGGLLQAAGGDYQFQSSPRMAALQKLEAHFTEWLEYLTPHTDLIEHQSRWQQRVRGVVLDHAQQQLNAAGPQAMIGRYLGGEDKPRLVSASTLLGGLLNKLKTELPLATQHNHDVSHEQPEKGAA